MTTNEVHLWQWLVSFMISLAALTISLVAILRTPTVRLHPETIQRLDHYFEENEKAKAEALARAQARTGMQMAG